MIPHHAAAMLTAALLLLLLGPHSAGAFETSYVLEPFEGRTAPDTTWSGLLTTQAFKVELTTTKVYVGDSALQVSYDTATQNLTNAVDLTVTHTVRVLQENRPHICVGATHVSFWYHHEGSRAGPLTIRLSLLEDSEECIGCDNPDPSTWDQWTTIQILDKDTRDEWKEVRVALQDFNQTNEANTEGNNILDLHRIRGFTINFQPTEERAGRLQLDQLALVGGPDLFGASLHASHNFMQTVNYEGGWHVDNLGSEKSSNESMVLMDGQDGTLHFDYLVQHTESWGGLLAISYLAPGAAYYNVSNATYLTFQYQVNEPVSEPERVHLRFILADVSDCTKHCDTMESTGEQERYYSFNYILADSPNVTKQLSIELKGNQSNFSPFWLTGWSGALGNKQLDTDMLKGYTFEFNIDGEQGEVGSYATGAITFGDIQTVSYNPRNDSIGVDGDYCIEEQGIGFNGSSDVFRKKEFVGDRCCEVCDADPTCIYVLSTGRDCFLASRLAEDSIGLDLTPVGDYTVIRKEVMKSFWMDTAEKRGDFCVLCDCHVQNRTIDCRDKNLTVVPKTFNNQPFSPWALDLRRNPSLVLLGSGSLSSIAADLHELWLPKEMIHLGEKSLDGLPELHHVTFEGQEYNPNPLIAGGNIIAHPTDHFGSVCCGLGKQIVNLASPEGGLTFCNTTHVGAGDEPGIDSTFLPFYRYKDPTVEKVIFPSSDFMSEAAESAESCAEYCSNYRGCNYFAYDNRIKIAEPICLFLKDFGDGLEHMNGNSEEDFADEAKTLPGWTSGRPPTTRHVIDSATVFVEPNNLTLNADNDYQSFFEVSLGAHPMRGGVYVTPTLIDDKGLNVTIWPSRVGLYSANATAKVDIKVSGIEVGAPSRSFLIRTQIESCDIAFSALTDVFLCESNLGVHALVDIPYNVVEEDAFGPLAYVATILGSLAVLLVLATAALVQKNRTKKAIIFAQIEFLRLLLAGSLLTSTGAVLLAVPPTDGTCMTATWFIQIGLTLELVPLIVKIAALNRLMAAAEQMRRVKLNRNHLFGAVALILALVVAFMILWSVLDPVQKAAEEFTTVVDDFTTVSTTYYCSGFNSVWSIIAMVWSAILLLSASVLAFQTRKIKKKDFNESQTLAFLIYSHFIFICVRLALQFLSEVLTQATLNQCRSILNSADSIVAILIYFLPKLLPKEEIRNPRENAGGTLLDTNTIIEENNHDRRVSMFGMGPKPTMGTDSRATNTAFASGRRGTSYGVVGRSLASGGISGVENVETWQNDFNT